MSSSETESTTSDMSEMSSSETESTTSDMSDLSYEREFCEVGEGGRRRSLATL
jgi:hypothetical protein